MSSNNMKINEKSITISILNSLLIGKIKILKFMTIRKGARERVEENDNCRNYIQND